jgi:hypothetical protein
MVKADPDDARYFDNQDHEGDQKSKVDKELRDELERLHHRHLLCHYLPWYLIGMLSIALCGC